MQRSLFFLILVLVTTNSYTQHFENDQNLYHKFIHQEANYYRQMLSYEQQITLNQTNYDVKYYSLNLTLNPTVSNLTGIVEVIGVATGVNLNHVELNFWDGMTITDVHMSDSPAVQLSYSHENNLLIIELNKEYVQGEPFRFSISYYGQPQNFSGSPFGNAFGFDTHNGKPMIWTFSQPFSARSWWPCKDIPSDKADSLDIRVTVPKNLIVASNGLLSKIVVEGENATYWWHEKHPISTYLVSLAVYPYTVYYDKYLYNSNVDTMKIHFYVFPENYDKYYSLNAKVKEMIAFFAELFGEYPFVQEKYGHADYIGHSGGMEHQTCTSIGSPNEGIYAHELAHQWWGDLITCDNYHHLWLNEGFAVYSHALWWTHAYPLDYPTASDVMMKYFFYRGSGTVYAEDQEDAMANGPSYSKGAWILHMLRHIVGDTIFFDILKTYRSSPDHQYGTAITEDFQAICEQVSGMNLDKFFHQWIYEEYFPKYSYTWNYTQNGSEFNIDLVIQQNQTNYIFWMPIDVGITTESGDTTFVVGDSLQIQSFKLSVLSEPTNLELDQNNWILKSIQATSIDVDTLNIMDYPKKFALEQNYPNPFNAETIIKFYCNNNQKIKIVIYDIQGREIRTLINRFYSSGNHIVKWNGKSNDSVLVQSGVYFYRLYTYDRYVDRKMVLLK